MKDPEGPALRPVKHSNRMELIALLLPTASDSPSVA